MDIKAALEIAAIAGSILLHSVVLAFFAGKILQQLTNVCIRMDKWEKTMDRGGFAPCQLHGQRLDALEAKIDNLEDRIN